MHKKPFSTYVISAWLLLGIGLPAAAQSEKGAILGSVTDVGGGAVPNAAVKVTNTGTNVTQEMHTNSEGYYEAPFLSPGTYRVSISSPGFDTAVINDISLHVGDRARADATLQVGKVETQVEVTAG